MGAHLEVRDGFLVLLAALWCVDEGGVLPLFLLAAAVHEGGHLLTLRVAGGRLHRLTLTGCGAVLHCALPDGRCARAAVCLAGPAASLALTALAEAAGQYPLAGASALLGLFNLLPLPPLDGGMVLAHLSGGRWATARHAVGLLTLAALLLAGVGLWRAGGGGWLLLLSLMIGARAGKDLAKTGGMV